MYRFVDDTDEKMIEVRWPDEMGEWLVRGNSHTVEAMWVEAWGRPAIGMGPDELGFNHKQQQQVFDLIDAALEARKEGGA